MKKNGNFSLRLLVQIFFLCLVFLIVRGKTLGITLFEPVSLHVICPFGGVESIYQFLTTGAMVRRVHESAFVLMYAVFILAVLFGAVFCGWICPFGTVQEIFGKIGRKIFKSRYNAILPAKIDNILRYTRYFILALVLYNTARSGQLFFEKYDPYFALFHMFTNQVALTAYTALGIVLLFSLIAERPFCKYACPYGAMLGIFNLFSVFRIRREKESCTSCGLCDKKCPMNIKVSVETALRNHQCISCLECTSEKSCPVKGTVIFGLRKKAGKP